MKRQPTRCRPPAAAPSPAVLEVSAGALAIVPFENLTPVLKVLHLNGVNILSNTLGAAAYPLTAGGGRFWHGERSGRCGAASTHHTADEPQPRQVDDRDHDRCHRDGSRYRISHGDERLRLPCPGDRADSACGPTSHTSAMKCRSWKAVSSTPR